MSEQQCGNQKQYRRPEYRCHGGADYIFLIGFLVVKTKKGGFHTIGQNHVEENDVRENDGYFSVGCFGKQFGIERHEEKTHHARKDGCESVYGGLLEKFFVESHYMYLKLQTKISKCLVYSAIYILIKFWIILGNFYIC